MTQKCIREIPLARPDITDLERKHVNNVLGSSQLSVGSYVENFEGLFAKYIGVAHAVAVNSGTSALHLIVRSLGIEKGDKVITTPFSFIASSNCILYERATPVFVDIDLTTYNMDLDKVERRITKKTKAILGVDIFGYPMDWSRLTAIAQKHNVRLIDDACEALGASLKGKMIGAWADASAFAFYPNKQITTGEGGMITTNNTEIADLCRSMRNQGRNIDGGWLLYERLGYNYRLDEMSSALGFAQLKRVEEILGKRQRVADRYTYKLSGVDGIVTPPVMTGGTRSWWGYAILIEDRHRIRRELSRRGISTRDYFPSIHLQPIYNRKRGSFPCTEYISDRALALPFYSDLTDEEVDYVVENLKEVL